MSARSLLVSVAFVAAACSKGGGASDGTQRGTGQGPHRGEPIRVAAAADLAIAFAYNVGAVALCAAGLMRPWLAAILMPASSLATLAFTTWFLDRGARRWTS